MKVGDRVKIIYQAMQEAQSRAKEYNEQETLFEFDVSSTTSTLAQLVRDFEP
jgi:hypothetical protein